MWQHFHDFFRHRLWQASPTGRGARALYTVLRVAVVMWEELAGGQLTLRAMSLVYTTLLSLVPLLAVSFSVLKAFGVHNQVEPLLLQYLEPLGSRGEEIAGYVMHFVDNMKVGVLGSVGMALLLYTVVSLLQKVESAFNYVWRVRRTRSLPRRFSDYLSVILVGPVLVFSALGLTASLLHSALVQRLIDLPVLGAMAVATGKLLPYALIIAAFAFIYMFIPNTKVTLRSALVGAVVGGVLWESIGLGFALFIASTTTYTAIYSGFAILIFFMIWLYLSWFILLIGAQISYFHQHPQQIRPPWEDYRVSARLKERAGLLLMAYVAEAHGRGSPLLTHDQLVERMELSGDVVGELTGQLLKAGFLLESGDEPPGYLPGRDPEQILLIDLLNALRSAEERLQPIPPATSANQAVSELAERLQQALETTLDGVTLKDLVLGRLPLPR